MINYPAVSADWQTLTGSRPTMCLPQVCCITDSSRPSLDPTIISPAALSNPLGDGCCCSSSSYICRIPLNHKDPCHSGSHDPCRRVTLWAVRTTAWPPPPSPLAAGGLKLRPRSPDAPTQTQTTTQTCHESTYVVYTGNQTSGRKGAHGRFFPPTSSRLFLNKHSCRGRCAAGDAKNASGLNVFRVNHSNCHRNDFCNVHLYS